LDIQYIYPFITGDHLTEIIKIGFISRLHNTAQFPRHKEPQTLWYEISRDNLKHLRKNGDIELVVDVTG
jgi:hypothetical protein